MNDATPTPEDRLRIDEDTSSSPAVFTLEGELDPHTSPMLQARIDAALEPEATSVVLDFAAVGFVDSAGLRVIADTHRRLADAGGSLVVRNPSSGLRKLLDVTGLADHVTVES